MIVPTPQPAGGLPLVVELDRDTFVKILMKTDRPLVLTARSGLPKTHKYLTCHGGFYFLVRSKQPLDFSLKAEVITVKKFNAAAPGLGL